MSTDTSQNAVTAAAPSSRQSTGPALSGKTHARSALASLDAIYR